MPRSSTEYLPRTRHRPLRGPSGSKNLDDNSPARQLRLGFDTQGRLLETVVLVFAKAARPQRDYLDAGDTLVVWRLDRLDRSLPHLVEIVRLLGERQVEFRSLTEAIDTTSPSGRLLFHVVTAFAGFERDLIQERIRAGLAAARASGGIGGRPTVMTPDRLTAVRTLIAGGKTHAEAASAVGVSLSSLRRAVRRGR